MKHEKEIRVLIVAPGEVPVERTIENSLAAKQAIVGGWIEITQPFGDNVCLICNEEGKLMRLPLNRLVGNDIIAGTFILASVDEDTGEFVSLTDEQTQHYMARFAVPEIIITAWQRPGSESGKGASAWPRR